MTCYDTTIPFVNRYLKEINSKAKELKLHKTNFSNPHGLVNKNNVSTAKDMIALSVYSASNSYFNEIMNTKEY